ncbi:protein GLUTAMINE DUMPER 4-like [Diospyros lotus]|uniref:protein GLUTAMINE DUMPER 4-like n=1 Tax=Diospyros lotus TaxID=55363 RepID=UPI002252B280|nr:protein GLUTAMINE DUMPER 4-like [Diospyros lotus]XP_052205608.1 protein GLUTAMINE DUMPER 4-like [Diospyros lotus]
MRPPATTTKAADGELPHWSSTPMPYLFGGLALVLVLISFALLVLACSYKKSPPSNSSGRGSGRAGCRRQKPACEAPQERLPETEPKIVVIMAGDENPTYLAKPSSSPV